jgi:hypothetical protein
MTSSMTSVCGLLVTLITITLHQSFSLESRMLKIERELAMHRRLVPNVQSGESHVKMSTASGAGMPIDSSMNMPMDDTMKTSKVCPRGATTGFMGGFQAEIQKEHVCLALFSRDWVLDSTGKHVIATVFVFAFGIANAVVSWARQRVLLTTQAAGRKGRMIRFFTYAFELSVSYLLMLIVMSYWVWFFLAAVFGQAAGHFYLLDQAEVDSAVMREIGRTPDADASSSSISGGRQLV